MTPDDTRRLKSLEAENGKLKKMLADKLLEIDVLKEINAKKWRARPGAADRSRTPSSVACPSDARARDPNGSVGLGYQSARDKADAPVIARCASSRPSTRVTATAGSGSSSCATASR